MNISYRDTIPPDSMFKIEQINEVLFSMNDSFILCLERILENSVLHQQNLTRYVFPSTLFFDDYLNVFTSENLVPEPLDESSESPDVM